MQPEIKHDKMQVLPLSAQNESNQWKKRRSRVFHRCEEIKSQTPFFLCVCAVSAAVRNNKRYERMHLQG